MTEKVTESPKKVTETQSSTSPPCSEGTEEHKSLRGPCRRTLAAGQTGRGMDRTLRACGTSAVVLDAGRGTGGARQQTNRRALVAAPWDEWTRARRKAARSARDRQTWDGQSTRSAVYTWVLADLHQHKRCDTHCTRQVHMAHGSWSMGMSTEAQTGLLNCLGMGGTWVLMEVPMERLTGLPMGRQACARM